MSKATDIRTVMPQEGLPGERQEQWRAPALLSLDELRAEATTQFQEGLKYWKSVVFADRVHTDDGTLSKVRSGVRPVQYHWMLALAGERDAAQAVLARECKFAGFSIPHQTTTIQLSTSEARLLGFIRRSGLWRFAGSVLARDFYGCDLDLLEIAIDAALERRP